MNQKEGNKIYYVQKLRVSDHLLVVIGSIFSNVGHLQGVSPPLLVKYSIYMFLDQSSQKFEMHPTINIKILCAFLSSLWAYPSSNLNYWPQGPCYPCNSYQTAS